MEKQEIKTHTKKYRTLLKNSDKMELHNLDMDKKQMGIASTKPVDVAGCNPKITTNYFCRLQIQRQKKLNDNYDMNNQDELYVGSVFTEKELVDKIKRMIRSGRFDAKQTIKILRYFKHIRNTGWFDKFYYRGFLCVVTLDELGRWRVFVKYQYNSQRSIFYRPEDDDPYQCDSNSARCSVKGFPLGCWDYGDKLGLDDFIGLPTLVESEWSWDYFGSNKRQRKNYLKRKHVYEYLGNQLVDIRTPTKMVKLLVDKLRKEIMKDGLPLDEGVKDES